MDVARTTDGERVFAIRGEEDIFHTGVTDDGRQILMGMIGPLLVAYYFTPDGRLLGRDTRVLEHHPTRSGGRGLYRTSDPSYREGVRRQLARWQEELGFRPETIHVRAFTGLEGDFVKLEVVPSHLYEHGPDETDENRMYREQLISEWEAAGNFVLWWNVDFHMSKEGEVIST